MAIDIEELKTIESNSNKHNEKKQDGQQRVRKEKKVDSKDIVSTKKPLFSRIKELVGTPDPKELRDYIILDFMIPMIRNGLDDFFHLLITGETGGRSRSRSSWGSSRDRDAGYFDYRSRYGGRSSREREGRTDNRRRYQDDDRINYRNIILRSREAAEDIVYDMQNTIRDDGQISIAQFFDMLDLPSEYTDNNWGWTSKRDIAVRKTSNGYLIDVAEAEWLDN